MALPNFLPLPLMGGKLGGKWWTTLSNIESERGATGNQALQIGPQTIRMAGMANKKMRSDFLGARKS
uniref:Alternative protein MYST3 n=1 Tax=Homo sapiens TaxID=9606 RepID=L8E8C6_HUMAN|nr:alternative protein MYST3 [Homo sapiens]